MITVGELFAGIGGIGLGLERTGEFEVGWQVENDPYAIKVLEKNWPDVRRWDDVKTFPPADGNWHVDMVTGGFPCTDISNAGKRKGLQGEQSRLFYEIMRIATELKPRWVLMENVSALLVRGIGDVLGEVASISGSDDTPHFKRVEYFCFPAASIGAPHRRDRIWILADSGGNADGADEGQTKETKGNAGKDGKKRRTGLSGRTGGGEGVLADSDSTGLQGYRTAGNACPIQSQEAIGLYGSRQGKSQWEIEPDVGRVAHGISKRVDRLKCLGNAVVPQVAELIGEMLISKIKK